LSRERESLIVNSLVDINRERLCSILLRRGFEGFAVLDDDGAEGSFVTVLRLRALSRGMLVSEVQVNGEGREEKETILQQVSSSGLFADSDDHDV